MWHRETYGALSLDLSCVRCTALARRGENTRHPLQGAAVDWDWWETLDHDAGMSTERRSATAHAKPRRSAGGSGFRDIGQFVETYNHLQDKLYPVFAVWDLALYVTRYSWLGSVHCRRGFTHQTLRGPSRLCPGGRTIC